MFIKDEAQQISKYFVYDGPLKLYIDFMIYQREGDNGMFITLVPRVL